MDELTPFLPGGPNFGLFTSLANPIQVIIGVVLALAAIVSLVAIFWNLFKVAAALFGNKSGELGEAGKNLGYSALVFVIATFLAVALIRWVGAIGDRVQAAPLETVNTLLSLYGVS